jgi:hypothetical protein
MAIFNKQLEKAPKILEALLSAPATGAGEGAFFTKDVSGITEGFYVDSNGVEVQITSNGNLIFPSAGEVNTASNLSGDEGVFAQKNGLDLEFKSITAGSNVTLSSDANSITIDVPTIGEVNTASNLSGGDGIFAAKVGDDLQFKSLIAGSNISFTVGANTITIDGSSTGEANTASNVGLGNEMFKQKAGVDLEFRTLTAGTGINITNSLDDNEVVITATGGASSNIAVRDEGSIVETALSELNFTGTGVTASQTSPGVVEVAVTGGGGSGTDENVKVSSNDTTPGPLLDKLVAGTNITLTENNNGGNETITVSASGGSGETNTASNLAGDEGVFANKSGVDLEFKSLTAGSNITLSSDANSITIDAAAGSGETNTASNAGSAQDADVFKQKTGVDLEFRRLSAGANVTITENADSIEIASTGGGGGSSIEVEDEGSSLTTAVTKFNFVGAGVTVTEPSTDQVEVNIPGGGGSSSAFEELVIQLGAGVTIANKQSAAPVGGIPAGVTVTDGTDGSISTDFAFPAPTVDDLLIIHNKGKVAISVEAIAEGPITPTWYQKIPSDSTALQPDYMQTSSDGNQTIVRNWNALVGSNNEGTVTFLKLYTIL